MPKTRPLAGVTTAPRRATAAAAAPLLCAAAGGSFCGGGLRACAYVDRIVGGLRPPPAPRVARLERQRSGAEERERCRVPGAVLARLRRGGGGPSHPPLTTITRRGESRAPQADPRHLDELGDDLEAHDATLWSGGGSGGAFSAGRRWRWRRRRHVSGDELREDGGEEAAARPDVEHLARAAPGLARAA